MSNAYDPCARCRKSTLSAMTNADWHPAYYRGKVVCDDCGTNEDLQAHHPDYSKPDYVITLCRSCHRSVHKREVIANAI